MADREQLKRLKKGISAWNTWRKQNPNAQIDISGVNFPDANFMGGNFSQAHLETSQFRKAELVGSILFKADLTRTDLVDANLREADLRETILRKANLSGAYLVGAHIVNADLGDATISKADLTGADLSNSNLTRTNLKGSNLKESTLRKAFLKETILESNSLKGANLLSAIFSKTILTYADFSDAQIGETLFSQVDLSQALNLEAVKHRGPSSIDEITIARSNGKIPDVFLRGCGLNDMQIEFSKLFDPDLTNEEIVKIQYRIYDLRATQAIQIAPLFISYSHADMFFVNHLDVSLTQKGIRFWRDIHDATAGRLETQIDRAIRQNPTVLLVLSKNSLSSDWVEHEVRHARALEKELGRDTLCPIALDDAWKSSPWPGRLMEQIKEYNILDFSHWQDKPTFDSKFAKLLSGLEIFYKKPEA